jgi:AbrB family looped-hinge helix DNA binding protein
MSNCPQALPAGSSTPPASGLASGMFRTMNASIDRAGRVVIPKSIRDRLQLRGGEKLEVEESEGAIVLRPAATEVRVVETAEGPVAAPVEAIPPLTDELVRTALEQVRR